MNQEKTKNILQFVTIVICTLIFVVGVAFISVMVGQAMGRSQALQEQQALIVSYHETIKSKDDLIAVLTKANVTVTDAAASATNAAASATEQTTVATSNVRRTTKEVSSLKAEQNAKLKKLK